MKLETTTIECTVVVVVANDGTEIDRIYVPIDAPDLARYCREHPGDWCTMHLEMAKLRCLIHESPCAKQFYVYDRQVDDWITRVLTAAEVFDRFGRLEVMSDGSHRYDVYEEPMQLGDEGRWIVRHIVTKASRELPFELGPKPLY
jgi:hypothetical protein